jgi:hypothetical protein
MLLSVEAFLENNPVHKLAQNLEGGAFGRGLPQKIELAAQPDVVAVFRRLLKDGMIEAKWVEDEAVVICHRHGWIHSDLDEDNGTIIRYVLPSPLHATCLSWRLDPTNSMPQFASILGLSTAVISMFKPSQLHLPIRRVGTQAVRHLPEAQYQDEFYRSVFSVTYGNVRLSPEFASACRAKVAGRIDFFIPVTKWGIEITRDGNRLDGHSSRFANSGAYGAWLMSGDMADYILLDFRMTVPTKAHPGMIFLF